MKLTEVKLKQPEAYRVFKFWNSKKIIQNNRKTVVRDLYTFFDGCKIYIEIAPNYDLGTNSIDPFNWYYTINNGTDFNHQDFNNVMYKSRQEAEIAAFYRSFELLEIVMVNKKIKLSK